MHGKCCNNGGQQITMKKGNCRPMAIATMIERTPKCPTTINHQIMITNKTDYFSANTAIIEQTLFPQ